MINILYDCFKHWSKTGSVYIYSDMHFSDAEHFKLLKANNNVPEGINSVEELDEYQIKNINEIVHKCDTLICLGDVGNVELVKRLKAGRKILLTGNHDRGAGYYQRVIIEDIKYGELAEGDSLANVFNDTKLTPKDELIKLGYKPTTTVNVFGRAYKKIEDNKLFDEVYSGPLMISDKVILSHEPIVPCPRYLVNLHGHTHDRPDKYEFLDHLYYNFCSEAIGYKPVSLSKLIKEGLLSGVDDIHRVAVDRAVERKAKRTKS